MSATKPFQSTICSSFCLPCRRPKIAQQKVLFLGIVLALATRTGFIGAAEITIFDCAFYLFGIVLSIMTTVEDGGRVMTPMLLLGKAHQAHDAVGPTRRRGYDR
jgi:hypothetical protein